MTYNVALRPLRDDCEFSRVTWRFWLRANQWTLFWYITNPIWSYFAAEISLLVLTEICNWCLYLIGAPVGTKLVRTRVKPVNRVAHLTVEIALRHFVTSAIEMLITWHCSVKQIVVDFEYSCMQSMWDISAVPGSHYSNVKRQLVMRRAKCDHICLQPVVPLTS